MTSSQKSLAVLTGLRVVEKALPPVGRINDSYEKSLDVYSGPHDTLHDTT